MDPAVYLPRLRQGNQAIEEYVEKFCELCFQVDFNDIALKGIFRNGLNDFLNHLMPDSNIPVTLEKYIDLALLLAGSLFTVGIADEEPCYPPVSATPEDLHVMSGVVHIMSTTPESAHVMPATPRPAHVMSATPRPTHVMSAMPRPAHAMPAKPKPAHIMPAKPKPAHIMPARPRLAHVMPAKPKPAHIMPAKPKPAHAMSATPGPAHVMPAKPVPVHVMPAKPAPARVIPVKPRPARHIFQARACSRYAC